jgi:hypothetical protein
MEALMMTVSSPIRFSNIRLQPLARRLLAGPALFAIAVSWPNSPANAQSFQAEADPVFGGASVSQGPNTTTINIDSPINVINWLPSDTNGSGEILFQPAGTTATFQASQIQDFTVLNRILPTDANGLPVVNRPIRFEGTVQSQINNGVVPITGGTLLFYTPGGIILGANSVFDVGSLVLSTSDIDRTNLFTGNAGTLSFLGTSNPDSAISLESGAKVNALIDRSSYVAMVAPRIVQGGDVTVNGSVAYVAAEAATLSVNLGLFDIAVQTGTADPNGVVHQATGTTTGPATNGPNDPQRIFMMAVPKNAALTMLLGGSIGYPVAATAVAENGAVVLSAGYDVTGGVPSTPSMGNGFASNIQHSGTINTGGDIIISATGDAAMDGLQASNTVLANTIGVFGFNTITSGSWTDLTSGAAITGGNITAGSDIIADASTGITLSNINSGADFFASTASGPLAIGTAIAGDDIGVRNAGTGLTSATSLTATGDLNIFAGGNVTIGNAVALGTSSIPSGTPIQGTVYVIANGDANIANANAATTLAVRAANIVSTGTLIAGEDIYLEAVGATNVANASAGDDIDVISPGGIVLTNGIARADARDDRQVQFDPGGLIAGIPIAPSFSAVTAAADGADIRLTSTGGNATGAALNAGDDVLINASGAANFTGLVRTRGAGITGGVSNIQITAGSSSIDSGNSFTDVLITTTGATSVTGTVVAGNNIAVTAGTDVTGGGSLNAIARVDIVAGGVIDLGDVTAGTSIIASAAPLNPSANLTMRSVLAGSFIDLRSGGNIVTGNIAAGTSLLANAGASATFGNTAANSINVRAGQDAVFTGTAASATTLDVAANRQAVFNGIARAPTITVRSGDIAIGANGQLGVIGTTQALNLFNSAGAQMTIGGTSAGLGYSLSSAELARIFSSDITVNWTGNLATTGASATPPFTQPSVTIDALTITSRASNAAGNLAANGGFSINTPGDMRIIGTVALNGAGGDNRINLIADQSLQIIAGQGSVGIRNDANAITGNISLTSQNIIAASPSAITAISGSASLPAITPRLGLNDGNISDAGFLSAGTVNFFAGDRVFVQNSGATSLFRDRRGITANAINVFLANRNGSIVINGQIGNATGFATGLTAIPLLVINDVGSQLATGFDGASTMNGCQITAITACRQSENPISVTTDTIEKPGEEGRSFDTRFPTTLVQYKDFETFGYPPLIDEPVTGSGNDDLWPVICDTNVETCPS